MIYKTGKKRREKESRLNHLYLYATRRRMEQSRKASFNISNNEKPFAIVFFSSLFPISIVAETRRESSLSYRTD